tara:strand:+ start:9 stop:596 length:588 start_codon:yes stop_codon:yes gene_type:complete
MKRFEIKFDTSDVKLNKIISNISLNYLHPQRKIISIYYDTDDLKFFTDSEEGIVPRKKVRLRTYNNLNILNLEIKETKNDFRRKHIFKNVNEKNIYKVLKENFFYKDKLRPIVKIEYNRKYFKCIYGRITYDYGLKYTDLRYKNNQIFSNKTVLELKNDNINLKDKFIKTFFLKNVRFSKYCDALNMLINNDNSK